LKVSYKKAFSVKYSKNMRISTSQNLFRPIFKVIYHMIHTYIGKNLPHFGGIFIYFWGILGDYQADIFWGFFTKI
jgi:hypothetical protein